MVADNTKLDYEDKPQTLRPFELPQWAVLVIFVVLMIVVFG